MQKKVFTLLTLILLTSCMANNDPNQDQASDAPTEKHDSSKINNEQTIEEKEQVVDEREDNEAVLRHFVKQWKKPMSPDEKARNYQFLLELSKKGDINFTKKNYSKAWYEYSTGSIYYPSPRVLVKSGDALILAYISSSFTICKCTPSDINDMPKETSMKTVELDYLRYRIDREYGVALALNRYSKIDYKNEQRLSKEEEQQLVEKIECLNEKLDFEAESADVSILAPCVG